MRKPLPCMCCKGEGKDYSWADHDPIEGYKMANLHSCSFCEGTGTIRPDDPRYEAVKAYHTTMKRINTEEEKKKLQEKITKDRIIEKALSKLTKQEIDILGLKNK
jgi:hypothetical protein